jgi:hypothetical protein
MDWRFVVLSAVRLWLFVSSIIMRKIAAELVAGMRIYVAVLKL